MAVVNYQSPSQKLTRGFHPPKRADLKYWYKEAQKALKGVIIIPDWHEGLRITADITEETIVFPLESAVTLFIARKRHLKIA